MYGINHVQYCFLILQINPDACALEFLPLPEIQDVHEKVNKSAVPLNIITKANNFLKENPDISNTDELSSKLFENLKFSCEEISNIQEMTLGQSENKCWFEMRKGLLTASNFEKICTSKSYNDSLLAELMGYVQKPSNKFSTMCCDWGLKMEPKVRKLYKISECRKHKKLKIFEHGLKISEQHPFIACSIDGLVSCLCHSNKLIEIKCPFSLRNKHPKEAAQMKGCILENGTWHVTADGPYYHQIQGQLGIYGLQQCDLIIYTTKGYVVIPVYYDDNFFQMMVSKLKKFYVSNVLQELISGDVKKAIAQES